jgi:hypothetical protein
VKFQRCIYVSWVKKLPPQDPTPVSWSCCKPLLSDGCAVENGCLPCPTSWDPASTLNMSPRAKLERFPVCCFCWAEWAGLKRYCHSLQGEMDGWMGYSPEGCLRRGALAGGCLRSFSSTCRICLLLLQCATSSSRSSRLVVL